MSNKNSLNKGVKEAGMESEGFLPGRCPMGKQRGPNRHPATVRRKWSKEDNKSFFFFFIYVLHNFTFTT